ncbi:MAG TPA: ECF-type sigma factor [Povalibacter sp.]|nr:ECF-type sigma factor [Povalibacter sp.]
MGDLTTLIRRAHQGDAEAREEVYRQLYGDLCRLARSRLARSGRNTLLDTSALVNEAYIRLAGASSLVAEDRHRYLAYASRAMRSVVVDLIRSRATARRGSLARHVSLDTSLRDNLAAGEDEILRVQEALEELITIDERAVRVVEMRYFAGLAEKEIAEILGVTERTVRRDWEKARLLLAAALK